jgi:hypothetical protein
MRHVTILGLMIFVLACGVGTAALNASTTLWESIVFSTTLTILASSILLTVQRRRTFWLGFALFGWIYLIASLIPPVESRLLSTKGIAYLDAKTAKWQNVRVSGVAFSGNGHSLTDLEDVRIWDAQTGKPIPRPFGSFANFRRIGHSLLALLAGTLGGFMGTWLQTRIVSAPSGVRDWHSRRQPPGQP